MVGMTRAQESFYPLAEMGEVGTAHAVHRQGHEMPAHTHTALFRG